jgi:hypothetical protein
MGAVFLHSGWRTGSTYVWEKFRRQDGCVAFYEPFNDLLARLSPVGVLLTSRHDGGLRHPALDRPYFHEYIPLLGDRGHPLFRDEFVCRNYFVANRPLPEQQRYIESLVDLAYKAGKTPVLGFVRTLGRVAWFKERFKGVNIVLLRSPFSQWVSGQKLATERGYRFFDPMHFLILSQGQGSAVAIEHARHHGIPRYEQLSHDAGRMMITETVAHASPAARFAVFASVYFLSHMAALPHADLVVDMDRLSAESDYRAQTQRALKRLTGCDIDFADAGAPRYEAADAPPEVIEALRRVAGAIGAGRDRLWDDRSCADPAAAPAARATLAAKFADDCQRLLAG